MRRIALALLLLACKKDPTATGTTVLNWSRTQSTSPGIATAKVDGVPSAKDFEMTATPKEKGPVVLLLHVETAALSFTESTENAKHTVPTKIEIKIASNDDWQVTSKCDDGPNYQMPSLVGGKLVTPDAMVHRCSVTLKYGDKLTEAIDIEVMGDGTVKPTYLGGSIAIK